jgi:glycosyltransferase involved in cell wall biosynthesis
MKNNSLSIAIPTYNRPLKLIKTLDILVAQCNDNIEINVYDNNSKILSNEVDLNERFKFVKFHRNKTNIGLSGNILKCLENCNSDWLWILSDDDTPSSNAIEIIQNEISKYPNACFINFRSNLSYKEFFSDIVCKGVSEVVDKMVSFSNLLFISTGIYNVSKIKESIKSGYYFAPSFAPHLGVVFDHINKFSSAEMVYSSNSIVEWNPADKGDKWSDNLVNRSVQSLCYLISDKNIRGSLFDKINSYHPLHLPKIRNISSLIIHSNDESINEILRQYIERMDFLFYCNKVSKLNILYKNIFVLVLSVIIKNRLFRYILKLFISNSCQYISVSQNVYLDLSKDNRL